MIMGDRKRRILIGVVAGVAILGVVAGTFVSFVV